MQPLKNKQTMQSKEKNDCGMDGNKMKFKTRTQKKKSFFPGPYTQMK
jgi:hypothetical protein